MKYYIIAGERSGDLHGSNLVKELLSRDQDAEFKGFGGDAMSDAGVELSVHFSEIAVMGVTAVLKILPRVLRLLKKCKSEIESFNPDVVILIDFGAFNMRIAKFAKRKGIKVFYYISPKVWAWNQNRANKIKHSVDRMFVILPFEKEFYQRFDYDVDYVGNPVADAIKNHRVNENFLRENNFDPGTKVIALLPGSRKLELKRMLPAMAALARGYPNFVFAVAAINSIPKELYEPVKGINNIKLIYEQTYDLLAHSYSAIVTSGTATLETALWKVPQVVVYRSNAVNHFFAKLLVKVKFISLVNLIADKEVVKELLHNQVKPEIIKPEFEKIANQTATREFQLEEYEKLINELGKFNPSAKTADLMLEYLKA